MPQLRNTLSRFIYMLIYSEVEFIRYSLSFVMFIVTGIVLQMKWNDWGFKPLLCTYRLNWARRSEAENATSRSRRFSTILSFTGGWGRKTRRDRETNPEHLAWKAAVLTTTLGPPPILYSKLKRDPSYWNNLVRLDNFVCTTNVLCLATHFISSPVKFRINIGFGE